MVGEGSGEDRGIGAETGTETGIRMKRLKTANPVANIAIVTTTAGTVAIAHLPHNKSCLII